MCACMQMTVESNDGENVSLLAVNFLYIWNDYVVWEKSFNVFILWKIVSVLHTTCFGIWLIVFLCYLVRFNRNSYQSMLTVLSDEKWTYHFVFFRNTVTEIFEILACWCTSWWMFSVLDLEEINFDNVFSWIIAFMALCFSRLVNIAHDELYVRGQPANIAKVSK